MSKRPKGFSSPQYDPEKAKAAQSAGGKASQARPGAKRNRFNPDNARANAAKSAMVRRVKRDAAERGDPIT